MKKTIAQIFFSLILTVLLISYPVMLIKDMLQKEEQYKQLVYHQKVLSIVDVPYSKRDSGYIVTFMNGTDITDAFNAMSKALQKTGKVIGVDKMNMNREFVSDIYSGVDVPDHTYENTDNGEGLIHKRLSFTGGESYVKTRGYTFSSYTLTPYFARVGLLDITDGEMIDFKKEYAAGDTVEVVVTNGMGYAVGDSLCVVLNALNSKFEQVYVKAKVVGITQKGVFLPCYPDYLEFKTTVGEAYDAVFNTEMLYLPDISNLYTYNYSPGTFGGGSNKTGVTVSFFMDSDTQKAIAGILDKYGAVFEKNNAYGLSNLDNYGQSERDNNLKTGAALFACVLALCCAQAVNVVSSVRRYKKASLGMD